MADFGVTEDGHPDEVALPVTRVAATKPVEKAPPKISGQGNESSRTSTGSTSGPSRPMQPPSRAPMTRSGSSGQQPPRPLPQTPQAVSRAAAANQSRPAPQHGRPNGPAPPQIPAAQAAANGQTSTPPPANSNDQIPDGPVAFFSARSVKTLLEAAPPGTAPLPQNGGKLFDPKLESPSIRKTPGIDHGSTKPVGKDKRHVDPIQREEDPTQRPAGGFAPASQSSRPSLSNVVNPSLNQARQIGAPGGHSPLGNRGQYRPPTMMKRPADGGARPPLNDMTTNSTVAASAAEVDAKRQKVG